MVWRYYFSNQLLDIQMLQWYLILAYKIISILQIVSSMKSQDCGGVMKKTLLMTMTVSLFLLVSAVSGTSAADYLPDQIRSIVQSQAKERYPENEVLQQRLISLQTQAYFRVQEYQNESITDQEMKVIKGQAARKFPNNYISQLTHIDTLSKKILAKKEKKPEVAELKK